VKRRRGDDDGQKIRRSSETRNRQGQAVLFSLLFLFYLFIYCSVYVYREREGGSFAREREACERFVTCFALSRLRAARVNLDIFVHIVLFVCCQPPINKLTSASRTICIQDALCLRV
jgi:hypothetical protein